MMKRFTLLSIFFAIVACGSLRAADNDATLEPTSRDGSAPADDDDDDDDDAGPTDGGAKMDSGPAPTLCDEGCPIETVAPLAEPVNQVQVTATHVFFTTKTGLFKCSKTSCTNPIKLASSAPQRPVVLNDRIYWHEGKKIMSVLTNGGSLAPFAAFTDTADIYLHGGHDGYGGYLVWSRMTSGPGIVDLRSCRAASCAVDVLTLRTGIDVRAAAIRDGQVAYIDGATSGVRLCADPVNPAPPALLGGDALFDLAMASDRVLWTTPAGLVACPFGGCAQPPKPISGDKPTFMATDATHVYWRSSSRAAILRCALSGCVDPEVIASNVVAEGVSNVALDDTHAYWITPTGVFRRRK